VPIETARGPHRGDWERHGRKPDSNRAASLGRADDAAIDAMLPRVVFAIAG
jgi:hypothetical protein